MTKDPGRSAGADGLSSLRDGAASASPPTASIPSAWAGRAEKWRRFDRYIAEIPRLAPAFVEQAVEGGLWSVQEFIYPARTPRFSVWHRLRNDPPDSCDYLGFYNGWPGDHRGWMEFQTKEDARDFYKFATGRMSFEEFRQLDNRPLVMTRIDLDAQGEFASAIEARSDATAKTGAAEGESAGPKDDAQGVTP